MLERVPWIVLAAFPAFREKETMSNEFSLWFNAGSGRFEARTSVSTIHPQGNRPLAARFLPTIIQNSRVE